MDVNKLRDMLEQVSHGQMNTEEALEKLKHLPYDDLGYATIDQHRNIRCGEAEVIFGLRKTPAQIAGIVAHMRPDNERILVTRASKDAFAAVREVAPEAVFHEEVGIITIGEPPEETKGRVAVLSAGTSDIPVAEEAALVAEYYGLSVARVYDVGVAGIHRLFGHMDAVTDADVVIVVAGMEGALASVVGDMVEAPVIAVPTSVGYGASFGGLAALLSMVNSCANGIGVVNIDNGFGAAALAEKICRARS